VNEGAGERQRSSVLCFWAIAQHIISIPNQKAPCASATGPVCDQSLLLRALDLIRRSARLCHAVRASFNSETPADRTKLSAAAKSECQSCCKDGPECITFHLSFLDPVSVRT
jgi:hypothetical protein